MSKQLLWRLLLLSGVAHSQTDEDVRHSFDALFGEHENYEQFYYQLVEAIREGDARKTAELNSYPLSVNTSDGALTVESAAEFIAQYDTIVNDNVLAEVRKSTFDALWGNARGIAIGQGQIWFTGICVGTEAGKECDQVDVKVITYNTDAPASKLQD